MKARASASEADFFSVRYTVPASVATLLPLRLLRCANRMLFSCASVSLNGFILILCSSFNFLMWSRSLTNCSTLFAMSAIVTSWGMGCDKVENHGLDVQGAVAQYSKTGAPRPTPLMNPAGSMQV